LISGLGGVISTQTTTPSITVKQFQPPDDLITKKLNWTAINKNRIKESFWTERLQKEKEQFEKSLGKGKEASIEGSSCPSTLEEKLFRRIDEELLLKHFAESKVKAKKEDSASLLKKEEVKLQKKALEDKRIMSLSIALAKVSISNEALKKVIFSLNENKDLTVEDFDKIYPMLPTKEDKEQLDSFKGDKEKLSAVEKFVVLLLKIPKHKEALEYIKFKMTVADEVDDISSKLSTFYNCFEILATSSQFQSVLLMVLSVGNYLNHGTRNGGCVGFELKSLGVLDSIKSFLDMKFNLLLFLVKNIKTKEPSLLLFHKDLALVEVVLEVTFAFFIPSN
jgi:diaphanous 2